MKDIYELFNDVNINEDEFEEIEVNDIEKAIIKRKLKNSIKKKGAWKKKSVAVATAAIISTATFGIAFPAYAKNVPIVGDIFRALDNGKTGVYDNYKENANELNITKTSNGVSITINDAIFDGRTIVLTYTIESDTDLGEEFSLVNHISIKDNNRFGAVSDFKVNRISGNTYVAQESITILDFVDNPEKDINIQIKTKHITPFEESKKEVSGKWNFDISLTAIDGNIQRVGKSVEEGGIIATINEISITPMSMFISYNQKVSLEASKIWDSVDLDIQVKDDLGNIYEGRGNGGTGKDKDIKWSKTFGKLKEGATKLIITPNLILKELSDPKEIEVEVKDGKTGETSVQNTETWDAIEVKEIILEDIIINIENK